MNHERKIKEKIIIIIAAAVVVIAGVIALIMYNTPSGEMPPQPFKCAFDGEEITLNKTTMNELVHNGWEINLKLDDIPEAVKGCSRIFDETEMEKDGKVYGVCCWLYKGQTNGEATPSEIYVKDGTVSELTVKGKTVMLGKDTVQDIIDAGWELGEGENIKAPSENNTVSFVFEYPLSAESVQFTIAPEDGQIAAESIVDGIWG